MAKGRLEDSIDSARWIWATHNRRGPSVSSFFHTSRFLTLKCRVQVFNVQVPLLFKSVVDALNVNVDIMASSTARLLAGSLIIGCTSSSYPPRTCSHETYRRSRPYRIYTLLRAPQRNIRESRPGGDPESCQGDIRAPVES